VGDWSLVVTDIVQCDRCGGIVAYDAARDAASCLFCGSEALRPASGREPLPPPGEAIPFVVDAARAEVAFANWARSSWWYPKSLRELEITAKPIFIPAWRFDAEVETHWAGLSAAPTRSGKRPASGQAKGREHAMIPASLGLTEHELRRLLPFEEDEVTPWSSEGNVIPFEVPSLSYPAALLVARNIVDHRRRAAISRTQRLSQCKASSLFDDVRARLLMLPVYVGGFRHRDRPYRFVINAQSGRVFGRAPLDRWKVALAVALVLTLLAAVLVWLKL
jgi:hypothetical protein